VQFDSLTPTVVSAGPARISIGKVRKTESYVFELVDDGADLRVFVEDYLRDQGLVGEVGGAEVR